MLSHWWADLEQILVVTLVGKSCRYHIQYQILNGDILNNFLNFRGNSAFPLYFLSAFQLASLSAYELVLYGGFPTDQRKEMLLHPKCDSALCSPIYFLMSRIKDGTPFQSGLLKTRSSQHHCAMTHQRRAACVEQTLELSDVGPSGADSGKGPETRPVLMP